MVTVLDQDVYARFGHCRGKHAQLAGDVLF